MSAPRAVSDTRGRFLSGSLGTGSTCHRLVLDCQPGHTTCVTCLPEARARISGSRVRRPRVSALFGSNRARGIYLLATTLFAGAAGPCSSRASAAQGHSPCCALNLLAHRALPHRRERSSRRRETSACQRSSRLSRSNMSRPCSSGCPLRIRRRCSRTVVTRMLKARAITSRVTGRSDELARAGPKDLPAHDAPPKTRSIASAASRRSSGTTPA
jgi:hypothetical protein